MSFTKFASLESAEVLDIKGASDRSRVASLDKISDFHDYRTEDGYLYARIRAISSRVNKNHDGWPSIELAGNQDIFDRHTAAQGAGFTVEASEGGDYGFATFLGKPVFVDHHNSDPDRARGVIVDAKLHVEDHKTAAKLDSYYSSAPDNHMPPTWVELLLEVDANSFPKLAKAIIAGKDDSKSGIDGFSMGCFIPGTPITLSDGTRKPIEAIELGDEVLTHTGKTEPVTYLMKRKHKGPIYQVDTYGAAQAMLMTEEHPVWTKTGWVEAKDLKAGDHVLTPRLATKGHPGSFAFARLLGYYLAEGNLMRDLKRFDDGRPVSVEWSFHADEVEFVEEVRTLLDAIGYRAAGPYVKNSCATIRCNSPELAQRFLDYGNQHSWAKRLHPEVMSWDVENQRALLSAYFNGDGHFRHEGRVEVGTASKTLAEQLQVLSTRVGYRMTPPVKQHSPSAADKRPKYSMQATLVKPDSRTETNCHLDEQGLWRRITGVSIKEYDGHVYNFDVEGDDSYVAADCAVHNCDVEKSVCSICKNAAHSPDEYCEHVRLKGAEFDDIDKHGKKISKKSYEDCYGIKFFEISAVFDPADETALTRDVVHHEGSTKVAEGVFDQENPNMAPCPDCQGSGVAPYGDACPSCNGQGHLGDLPVSEFQPVDPRIPGPQEQEAEAQLLRNKIPTVDPSHPQYNASTKTAENPLPQSDLTHAPEQIDTLREESVCPVCGSTMDDTTCEICGFIEPPEGFQNPDLTKANPEEELPPGPDEILGEESELAPPDPLQGNNPGLTAGVNNEMANWTTKLNSRVAGRINPVEKPIQTTQDPQTEEPVNETVVNDETQPVTSSVRTAKQFIEAAERGKENHMSDKQKVAAEPVPAASPDKRVDVEGVGGVADASNEQASKADAQVDVEGKGGTGVEGVSADQEGVNVDQGDEHSKNIDGTKTDTWSGTERQTSPVGGDTYPSENGQGAGRWSTNLHQAYDADAFPKDDQGLGGGSAQQGNQPVDPAGKADDRVDVLKPVTTPDNNSGKTDTWSGTDGNGVNKQQDPVTPGTIEGEDIVNLQPRSSKHIFTAIKLADLEVDLGLINADEKYERMAELEAKSDEVVEAELAYASKVKTAGLKRQVRTARTAGRVPTLGRSTTSNVTPSEGSQEEVDESLFF